MFLIIFGLILRIRGLDFQSFWQDEISVIMRANRETWQSQFGGGSIGSSTFYCCPYEGIILRPWTTIFGHSEFISRFPMAISGSLLILVTSELGRKLHSEGAGIISAALVTVSYSSILYSQEARHYIISTLFIWTLFLYSLQREKPSKGLVNFLVLGLVFFSVLNSYNSRIVLFLGLFFLTLQNYLEVRLSDKSELKGGMVRWLFSAKQIRITMFSILALSISISTIPEMFDHAENDPQTHISYPDPEDPIRDIIQGYVTCDEYCRLGPPDHKYVDLIILFIMASPILFIVDFFFGENKDKKIPEIFLLGTSFGYLAIVIFLSENLGTLYLHRYNVIAMPGWLLLASLSIKRTIDILHNQFLRFENRHEISFPNMASVIVAILFVSHGTNLMVVEYSYYDVKVKEDFRGISEQYLDLESELDSYSIATANKNFVNYYHVRVLVMDLLAFQNPVQNLEWSKKQLILKRYNISFFLISSQN